ncbi:transcription termination factor MTEF1, chloroplastic [Cryptomeria japonica]|uniref:transcription termination factor MTEF1, chloroplastic n=1 Tax=Cryptomeria japonica TaxID=3369 RepID=UPI0027DA6C59|nr:transcription termination factor MTEF1, chloroplastic [Cryptomeria japonica]XP_059070036.1 transcription termination factor MTEF1, chloroplastic [Cryptomeria japonica]
MPQLNSPTRVPLSISAPGISPILKITSPFHRKSNFNTLIKAQTKGSEHSDQKSKYSIQSLRKNANSRDGADNFTATRSLDPTARSSQLLSLSFNLREKVLYLELMGVDSTKALRDNPSVLRASLSSIKDVVGYLKQMGILYKDFRKILGMCPQILTLNVNKDLVPVFSFFFEVKISRKDIRKSICRCPKLLICSVSEQLRPTLYYLKKLGCVIDCSNTVLLVSSVEKSFVPKLEYLQSLGFSYKEAVEMVVRAPNIFRASVENNLQPKIDFLTNEMGRKVKELLDFPQYFGFSLEKRIKPRHMLLVKYSVYLTLPDMLLKNDKEFLKRVKQLAG